VACDCCRTLRSQSRWRNDDAATKKGNIEEGASEEDVVEERKNASFTTFLGLNSTDEDGMVSPIMSSTNAKDAGCVDSGERLQAEDQHEAEEERGGPHSPGDLASEGAVPQETALLDRIAHLVDTEYDIIKAEVLLAELEASMRSREGCWGSILEMPLYARFRRRLDYFVEVGNSCLDDVGDWFLAYEDSSQTRSIHGSIDPKNGKRLNYRVRVQIPTSLVNVMAICTEVQLMREWNALVVGTPQVIGRSTAHYMVLNYQLSFLGGLQKIDVCNEIRRFSDPVGGFLAEYIESVPEDHPCYRAPLPGFKRPKTLLKNMWVACGPDQTVLIQVGRIDFPIAFTRWWATRLAGTFGRFVMEGLVTNSLRSATPGSPWENHISSDRLGLYGRLGECMKSNESSSRKPHPEYPDRVADFDLKPSFRRRHMQKMSQAQDVPGEDEPQPGLRAL